MFSSPKSTTAGILAFVALLATQVGYVFDADPTTVVNTPVIITSLWALIQGIITRDNDVRSEDAITK